MGLKDEQQDWDDASRDDASTIRPWMARQAAQKETGVQEYVD